MAGVVPYIEADSVAVATTRGQVVADPLGRVKEVVLELLAGGKVAVLLGVVELFPGDCRLVEVVDAVAESVRAWQRILEIVIGSEAAKEGVNEVELLF